MSSLPLRALAFLWISLMISACAGAAGPARGAGEVGKLAPALSIQSLNGKGAVSLSAAPGKVTVVQFFATWCAACKKSLAELEALTKQSDGKVDAIGISVDATTRGVADFAKAEGVSFPIAWDENHTMMWKWSVEKMPSTYILDAKGTVRFVHDTSKDEGDAIAREVALLTTELPASSPKIEVASASVPAAPVPVPVAEAPAAAAAEETPAPSEPVPTTKKGAKPGSAKKGVVKKAPAKKSAAR
jgi:cytochrome c biogenesis protein CcmG, thiol:disulfide interchange protein DsbE